MFREYAMNLAIPWFASLCAFLWSVSYQVRLFGDERLPDKVKELLNGTATMWLVLSSTGAFANMFFQKWRNKRRRKRF